MSLIVKITLLGLTFVLPLSTACKTQYFACSIFTSTLKLTNGILSDIQKFLKYFNDTAIVTFSITSFASFKLDWTSVFPNYIALYSKHLKLLVLAILALILVASSFE